MRFFFAKLDRDASADDYTQFIENLDAFDHVPADFGGIKRSGALLKSPRTLSEVVGSLEMGLSQQSLVALVELTKHNMRRGKGTYVGFAETYRNRFMPYDRYPNIGKI